MPRRALNLTLQSGPDAVRRDVAIENAVVAGWTGRDATAVEKHIRELEALGVKRPASTPIFYRVSAARLTTDAEIEVVGEDISGVNYGFTKDENTFASRGQKLIYWGPLKPLENILLRSPIVPCLIITPWSFPPAVPARCVAPNAAAAPRLPTRGRPA